MKKGIVLAALALSCVASLAHAADVSRPRSLVYAPTEFNWTGWSIGIQGGASTFGHVQDESHTDFGGGFSFDSDMSTHLSGGVLGMRADYDHQWGHFVLGGFADINKSWLSGTYDLCQGCVGISDIQTSKIDWYGSVGLTAGIAFDRLMIYGLAGGAYGVLNVTENLDVPGLFSYTTTTKTGAIGPTFGAGVKYAITRNLIAGVEYRMIDLKAVGTNSYDNTGFTATRDLKAHADIVQARLSYKF